MGSGDGRIEGEVRLSAFGWWRASTPPNQASDPSQLDVVWEPDQGRPLSFDDCDWWYRCVFEERDDVLHFRGLATLAQVWLNGALILESRNMFEEHRVPVRDRLQRRNELVICFRALNPALAQKRPRPRWKTKLAANQNLRWFRTTLLGRIPNWTSPEMAPAGIWRPVTLERDLEIDVRAHVDGTTGIVEVRATAPGTFIIGPARVDVNGSAILRLENAALWWPHTHGEPRLYDCRFEMRGTSLDCGRIGFRTIEAREPFAIAVNGVPVFCRGAVWTRGDRSTLALLRDAGANMVRVSGTMVYEDDAFYEACDELGMLVWQDFMFANMDYPDGDAEFVASVEREVAQQVRRLSRHPSVAVYCGNSEVEQQAAMVGVPRELWRNRLFSEVIPSLLPRDAIYVPSTPAGGALPFHVGSGVAHDYGVGAYRRPLTHARLARVRFASECLAFSNVPEDDVDGGTPRDPGADWDFAQVREHYARALFGEARSPDLARIATGEVMALAFSEWRSAHSVSRGGLVWFVRDLEPGAGWGILDHEGKPKACFFFLRRVWQPRTVVITDEGLDGLHLHVINESAAPLAGALELVLLRDGNVVVARGSVAVDVPPRALRLVEGDALLGAFYDTTYAYRFGPPQHDVSMATLFDEQRNVIAEAIHVPDGRYPTARDANVSVEHDGDALVLRSDRFVYAHRLHEPDLEENYVHLAPGRARRVRFRRTS